jgi:hypothetical protein
LVPSVVRYLPELDVCDGASALNAVFAVVWPVPPLAIARVADNPAAVPVVFWFNCGMSVATIALNVGTPAVPFGAAKTKLAVLLAYGLSVSPYAVLRLIVGVEPPLDATGAVAPTLVTPPVEAAHVAVVPFDVST